MTAETVQSEGLEPCPKPGEIRVVNGLRFRFIERELEGDKWEVLGPAEPGPDSPPPSDEVGGIIERLRARAHSRQVWEARGAELVPYEDTLDAEAADALSKLREELILYGRLTEDLYRRLRSSPSPLPEGLDLAELKALAEENHAFGVVQAVYETAVVLRLLSELETARGEREEASEAVERLTGAWSEVDRLAAANQAMFTRAEKAEADLSRALEALGPFARFADGLGHFHGPSQPGHYEYQSAVVGERRIAPEDFRRASEVYASLSKGSAALLLSEANCSAAQRAAGVLDAIEEAVSLIDVAVTYDSVGRQCTHVTNATEVAQAILNIVARHSADWVLVPREPTDAMINARTAVLFMGRWGYDYKEDERRKFIAMIEAAPHPLPNGGR